MIKPEVKELPKTIVPDGLQSAKLGEWSRLYKNMVDAYCRLPRHCGQEAIPLNPKEITAERLTAYVNRMMSNLNEQQQLAWKNLLSDALMNIKFIRNFFDVFPLAEFDVDENVSTPQDKRFKCVNKVEAINAVSTINVPEDCRDYFERVEALAKALNEMRDYEKSHGIQSRPIEEMSWYSTHADDFAQKYIGGYFQKKSTTQTIM